MADDDTRSGRSTYWTPAIGAYLADLYVSEDAGTYLFGRLAGIEADGPDDAAAIAGMRHFHEVLASQFDAVTLPTPDGLTVGVKRGTR